MRRAFRVSHDEYLHRRESRFQRVEAPLLAVAPREFGARAAEGHQEGDQGREAQLKLAVVVSESAAPVTRSSHRVRGPDQPAVSASDQGGHLTVTDR